MTKTKSQNRPTTAILHYSAPPIIGGVEAVIQAHCQTFIQNEYPIAVIAGRGDSGSLPADTDLILIPEIDSRHPDIVRFNTQLEAGTVPDEFDSFTQTLTDKLAPILESFDNLIVHNIFTKHFNLPLTAALYRLIDQGVIRHCIAWCHDFTWTSPNSRSKVFDGYPWDLLRTFDKRITYITISRERQRSLAALLERPYNEIQIIYNGVDPQVLLGMSDEGFALAKRLDLFQSDLNLLMPVRVTQAKNIEFALELVAALKARGIHPRLVHTGPPDPHDPTSMAYFESLRNLRRKLDVETEARFVFESGPDPKQPYIIELNVVGDLYRVSDVMLMPSHREGFGMPVLEAGLAGLPVISSGNVPAAVEIAAEDAIIFDINTTSPEQLATQLSAWMLTNPQQRMRRHARQQYTWDALFKQQIRPLLRRS